MQEETKPLGNGFPVRRTRGQRHDFPTHNPTHNSCSLVRLTGSLAVPALLYVVVKPIHAALSRQRSRVRVSSSPPFLLKSWAGIIEIIGEYAAPHFRRYNSAASALNSICNYFLEAKIMSKIERFGRTAAAAFILATCGGNVLANNANADETPERTASPGPTKVALITLEKSAYERGIAVANGPPNAPQALPP